MAEQNAEMYIPLALHVANILFTEDKNATYFSENNSDFLVETGAVKNMSYNDDFLRPQLVSNCNYDVLMGSTNVETPFKYEINYRNYFFFVLIHQLMQIEIRCACWHEINYKFYQKKVGCRHHS